MSLSKFNIFLVCIAGAAQLLFAEAGIADTQQERIATLEARLTELELRLSEAEKQKDDDSNDTETHIGELEVRVAAAEQRAQVAEQLAAESKHLVEKAEKTNARTKVLEKTNANNKLLWMQEQQWNEIKPGVSMEKVIELLGPPPRSLDSLKPRVDQVFYYQTSLKTSPNLLCGKISFKKDKVHTVEKPNFARAEAL